MSDKPRNPDRESERLEARAPADDKLPTYQELLDEAVEETFPASDPIASSAARRTAAPVHTPADNRDWKLKSTDSDKPAAQEVVAEFDDEQAARRARDEALADDLPTARLELPPQGRREGPAATLTVLACSERQRDRAMAIVRESGASRVKCK